jgi:hypothetical protein
VRSRPPAASSAATSSSTARSSASTPKGAPTSSASAAASGYDARTPSRPQPRAHPSPSSPSTCSRSAAATCAPQPYRDRRAQLQELIATAADAGISAVPSYDAASTDLAAATRALQLEGIVAKRLDSRYQPGQRSRAWLKHKRWRREARIATGWRPATDREPDAVFLARLASDGMLSYAGQASYGLAAQRGALLRALEAHERRGRSRHGIRSVRPAIGMHLEHHGRVGEGPLRDPVMRRFKVLSPLDAA